jgi:Kef-type K+ transport system membrane component KefB
LVGVLLGSSVLGWVRPDNFLNLLAQIGAVVLLFEAGVATDYRDFMKVKHWALMVAVVGVCLPLFLGYFVAVLFGFPTLTSIFIGATLTATSVGITVRVFRDLGKSSAREAHIVIGAAVVDDVIGLIILAAVVGLATAGSFSFLNLGWITCLAVFFLGGSLLLGNLAAAPILKFIHQLRVKGLLLLFALSFCLLMAWLAQLAGLAPIVGAFAAGLILSNTEHKEYVNRRIGPVAWLIVPIFFVMMGTAVDVAVFNPFNPANQALLLLAALLSLAAVLGKLLSGFAVREKLNHWAIGVGMVPRGEVGLIFASYGLAHGIVSGQLYAALLAVVFLTTFITPPILKRLLARNG